MQSQPLKLASVSDEMVTEFLSGVAPEQVQFVMGHYFKHGTNYAFGMFDENENILGVIRYCKQFIGDEQKCERITLNGSELLEAKINAFAVSPDRRNQGIGRLLQKKVISHAKDQGCFQVASYSTYDKVSNYAIKVSLGFAIQPELQSDGTRGCYFLMKL